MKTSLLAAASILAIGFSASAMAEQPTGTLNSNASPNTTYRADTTPHASPELEQRVRNDLNRAGDAIRDTYNDVKADVKAAVNNDDNRADQPSFSNPQDVNQRYSATGMIGKDVLNAKQEKIATVSDVILDSNGRATLVVVSDGGVLGLGTKEAAFDYSIVVSQNAEGDVFMPLNEEQISNATSFSYDPADTDADVRRIPQGGISVAQLLKSNLQDPAGKRVARIDNVTFDNGRADNLIVAFDTVMGLGGKKASIDFQDVQLVRESDEDVRVRLNANQSAAFENFKRNQAN